MVNKPGISVCTQEETCAIQSGTPAKSKRGRNKKGVTQRWRAIKAAERQAVNRARQEAEATNLAERQGTPAKYIKDKRKTWERGRKKQEKVVAQRWRAIKTAEKAEALAERQAVNRAMKEAVAADRGERQARYAARKARTAAAK